ncbi:FMN-binding protein [bacterium]|nr:FMN-binding protein [bacterium]
MRSYRLLILGFAVWLIHHAAQTTASPSDDADAGISITSARQIFPQADRLRPAEPQQKRVAVLSASGELLGYVLRTSPDTDDLVGYTGPNDLLIGLSPAGEVVQVRLLESHDTASHVESIRTAQEFWQQFPGWTPGLQPFPKIEGVSGSTLTSLAMAEAVQRRLSGGTTSLRFPEAVSLKEVQSFFPDANSIKVDQPRAGWTAAFDAQSALLGYVVRTSPATDNQIGYQGPTESLFSVSPDQQTILAVRIRQSYETPDYVQRIENDAAFLHLLAGRTLEDYRQLDFQSAGIEGVSGATITSFSIADGIRRRLRMDATFQAEKETSSRSVRNVTLRQMVLVGIIAGGLLMTFWTRLRGRWTRRLWQVAVIILFGFWLGDLLSLSLLTGWSRHGLSESSSVVLMVLAAVSLGIPWTTKQQMYCHQLCPHGVAQEWLGKLPVQKWHLPRRLTRWLSFFPSIILIVALALAVLKPGFDLTQLEPFDAWSVGTLAVASCVIAILGLATSVVLPQGYCRFGCPTGALLKFVRSHGQAESFGRQEAIASVAIVAIAAVHFASSWETKINQEKLPQTFSDRLPMPAISGDAFGTSWSVRLRPSQTLPVELRESLSAELVRIERKLSHWQPESETSLFNSSDTTLELEVSEELIQLLQQAKETSELTQGKYDITVSPLVDLWGYGPARRTGVPTDDEIATALDRVGWNNLHIDAEYHSLRKDHPQLQIDLGSFLQGYAADRLAVLLSAGQIDEFLIDVGGELRARGFWSVAIDDPHDPQRPLLTLKLKDQALATSGTYRPGLNGETTTRHLLSPVTGRPIVTDFVLCAVIAPIACDADRWATAYLSLPVDEALSLAESRHDAVLLVTQNGLIQKTSWWPRDQ